MSELRQPAVHDEKHVLQCVVDRGRGHAEAPQGAPDQVEVLLINGLEV